MRLKNLIERVALNAKGVQPIKIAHFVGESADVVIKEEKRLEVDNLLAKLSDCGRESIVLGA